LVPKISVNSPSKVVGVEGLRPKEPEQKQQQIEMTKKNIVPDSSPTISSPPKLVPLKKTTETPQKLEKKPIQQQPMQITTP